MKNKNLTIIRRLPWLLCVLALLQTSVSMAATPTDSRTQSPNFLLIIADDLGVDVLKSYRLSNQTANTPNLDRLANAGVVFENFWVTPACTTTRGALISGQHGFESTIDHVPAVMPSTTQTLQQRLKQADIPRAYTSGVFGKWHLGGHNPDQNHPASFGVDHYAGNLFNLDNYFQWTMTENGQRRTEKTYHTTKVTDLAIQFMQRNQGAPWFNWVAYSAPHTPFHNPPANLVSNGATASDNAGQYRLMVEAMDTEIGRLIENIPAADRDNTVIVFLGDNGTPRRVAHGNVFDRTHVKGSLFEGGIRTPLIVAGGPVRKAGMRESSLVNATDFFATFVDFAKGGNGLQNIPSNSVSFKGLLDGTATTTRRYNYSEWRSRNSEISWAIRDAQYKAVLHDDGRKALYAMSDVRERSPLNDAAKLNSLLKVGYAIRNGQQVATGGHVKPVAATNATYTGEISVKTNTVEDTAAPVKISVQGNKRCFVGNGLPNHDTGTFPNKGNPNRIQAQNVNVCLDANPVKNAQPNTTHRGSVGIAMNGVQFRPATADYYDADSRRGFSRDRSSGWNLEGIGARDLLGIDHQQAHVDNRGLYHYHAVSKALVSHTHSLIGYAADGFEIHFVGNRQRSSYQLKSGNRPTEPFGAYDGTYVEDWQYVAGTGSLDQCNGGLLNGKFVYYATTTYPFYPRCFWGNPSSDLATRGGSQNQRRDDASRGGQRQGQQQFRGDENRQRQGQRRRTHPRVQACEGLNQGAACSFVTPRGHERSGRCEQSRRQSLACRVNQM